MIELAQPKGREPFLEDEGHTPWQPHMKRGTPSDDKNSLLLPVQAQLLLLLWSLHLPRGSQPELPASPLSTVLQPPLVSPRSSPMPHLLQPALTSLISTRQLCWAGSCSTPLPRSNLVPVQVCVHAHKV